METWYQRGHDAAPGHSGELQSEDQASFSCSWCLTTSQIYIVPISSLSEGALWQSPAWRSPLETRLGGDMRSVALKGQTGCGSDFVSELAQNT